MKIIIVGCGKVGLTLTEQLNNEGHDITVIDKDGAKLRSVTDNIDVMGVGGTVRFTRCRWRPESKKQTF